MALGYAGWGAGQLEDEMLANSWLSVPATSEIVFELPFAQRWAAAAKTLGIDITPRLLLTPGTPERIVAETILAFDYGRAAHRRRRRSNNYRLGKPNSRCEQ